MSRIRKKEGFEGQRAIVLPRKIISQQCAGQPICESAHITDIGYYPRARFHYRKRLTGIDQNILVYCSEGNGFARIQGEQVDITPGDYFIIPSMTSHSYSAAEDKAWTIYWIHFKGKLSDEMCRSIISRNSGYKGSVSFDPKRIALFDEIYSNLERGYGNDNITYANMCLWHYIASFLFGGKFSYTTPKASNDVTTLAIDFMQQHLGHSLSLADVAGSVNLSVSHFAAVFHKKTGFAPIEYFNHLKIQKACQHLQFTQARVNEIANELGIEDSYYFSRLFKKIMGISPNEYRKKLLSGT